MFFLGFQHCIAKVHTLQYHSKSFSYLYVLAFTIFDLFLLFHLGIPFLDLHLFSISFFLEKFESCDLRLLLFPFIV